MRLELGRAMKPRFGMGHPLGQPRTLPDVIGLAVMMYARFPLSLWNVEDLFHERGVDWPQHLCSLTYCESLTQTNGLASHKARRAPAFSRQWSFGISAAWLRSV